MNGNRVKKKTLIKLVCALLLFAAFIVLIVFLKTVDVRAEGADGTNIGLAALNLALTPRRSVNAVFYRSSEVLGYLLILIAAFFALLGLIQVIARKGILKADRILYALGGLYILTALVYLLFEVVVVNYRPVLEDGKLAASFPSSHTMLACVCAISALPALKRYISSAPLRTALSVGLCLLAAFTLTARALSGVHWFTDILGGAIVSAALLLLFWAAVDFLPEQTCVPAGTAETASETKERT